MPVVSEIAFRVLGFPQNALAAAQADRDSIRGEGARNSEEAHANSFARLIPFAEVQPGPGAGSGASTATDDGVAGTEQLFDHENLAVDRVAGRVVQMLS